jgi:hypothetical protein
MMKSSLRDQVEVSIGFCQDALENLSFLRTRDNDMRQRQRSSDGGSYPTFDASPVTQSSLAQMTSFDTIVDFEERYQPQYLDS